MHSSDTLAAVAPVVDALERLGVAYYLGGSVVSSAYGLARSTLDVDLVADLAQEHVEPLSESLASAYYVDAQMISDAIARKSCFNLIHLATSRRRSLPAAMGRRHRGVEGPGGRHGQSLSHPLGQRPGDCGLARKGLEGIGNVGVRKHEPWVYRLFRFPLASRADGVGDHRNNRASPVR